MTKHMEDTEGGGCGSIQHASLAIGPQRAMDQLNNLSKYLDRLSHFHLCPETQTSRKAKLTEPRIGVTFSVY